MFHEVRASLVVLVLSIALTGIAYPLAMTGIGHTAFTSQARGSLIEQNDILIGSHLIGQNFQSDRYFHPRPSSAGAGYDANNSSGSNLSPTDHNLLATYAERFKVLHAENPDTPIPVDMIAASASGLDPDISVAAAQFQAPRVATARHMSLEELRALIDAQTLPKFLGVWGEARVNVLELNLTLNSKAPHE